MQRHFALGYRCTGIAALCFSAAACVTPEAVVSAALPSEPTILVNTIPADASLTFGSGVACQTPCKVIVREPVSARISKIGYRTENVTLQYDRSGKITIALTIAAPTADIEADKLPDL